MNFQEHFNTPKTELKVQGGMSKKGADMTGLILAVAGLVLALGISVALIICAIAYFYKA